MIIVQRKAWASSEAISGQLNAGHVGQHQEEQKHNEFHEFTRLLLTRQSHYRYVQCRPHHTVFTQSLHGFCL